MKEKRIKFEAIISYTIFQTQFYINHIFVRINKEKYKLLKSVGLRAKTITWWVVPINDRDITKVSKIGFKVKLMWTCLRWFSFLFQQFFPTFCLIMKILNNFWTGLWNLFDFLEHLLVKNSAFVFVNFDNVFCRRNFKFQELRGFRNRNFFFNYHLN